MNNDFCLPTCKFLSITEDKQDMIKVITGSRPFHICNKYDKRLYHKSAHPHIFKCEECFNEDKGDQV